MLMLLRADECADFLELLHECLAAGIAVKPRILSCTLAHRAVRIDDDHLFKIVAQPHLKVVRIVRRRHLDRARAKCRIDVRIRKEGNATLHHGQDQRLAHEMLVTFIVGVHRDTRITEHRLGTRRCNFNVVVRAINPIAQVPEMPLLCLMVDLDVGDRRRAARTPIRDARALIDQPLLIEAHEHLAHRARAALVHREPLALPVTGGTEHAQLIHDAVAVLLLPVPDAREELLSPKLEAVRALRAQALLDLCLCRNARMVAARNPNNIFPAHPLIAHEDVLQCVVECMPHVELSRHIRRRNHHTVWLTRLVCRIVKKIVFFPVRVPFALKALRVVCLWNICTGFLAHLSVPPERNAPVPRGRGRPHIVNAVGSMNCTDKISTKRCILQGYVRCHALQERITSQIRSTSASSSSG